MDNKTFDDWLKKYYPISAEKASKSTNQKCINHSIQKWKGVANLKEYNLKINSTSLSIIDSDGNNMFRLTGDTCSLCQKHYKDDSCNDCPLGKSIGMPCDDSPCNDDSLFDKSLVNPELMVQALEKLLD